MRQVDGYFIIIVAEIAFHSRDNLDKKHQGSNQVKQVLTQRLTSDVMKINLPQSWKRRVYSYWVLS